MERRTACAHANVTYPTNTSCANKNSKNHLKLFAPIVLFTHTQK
jgi:hypothetical protein